MIGNPENRRVTGFRASAEALGVAVDVLSWRELLEDARALDRFSEDRRGVRIESTGEDAGVQALLLARGAGRPGVHERAEPDAIARAAHGQVLAPRQLHFGFLDALDALERAFAERPAWRVLQPISTIRTCFDKHETAARLSAGGVPVAPSIDVRDTDALLAAHRAIGRPLWVKLTCGSSASCLGVLVGGDRPRFMTTVRTTPTGRFNSLRVCRLQGDSLIRTCDWLLAQGARVEVDVPKARLDAAMFDVRALVIRGALRFVVVRQSAHPITNLHLGGRRGDAAALRERLGRDGWDALADTCARVGRLLPHWHLGVDVVIHPDFRAHTVIEVNAFGDLLPGLSDGGRDVYGVEVAAALPQLTEAVLHSG